MKSGDTVLSTSSNGKVESCPPQTTALLTTFIQDKFLRILVKMTGERETLFPPSNLSQRLTTLLTLKNLAVIESEKSTVFLRWSGRYFLSGIPHYKLNMFIGKVVSQLYSKYKHTA